MLGSLRRAKTIRGLALGRVSATFGKGLGIARGGSCLPKALRHRLSRITSEPLAKARARCACHTSELQLVGLLVLSNTTLAEARTEAKALAFGSSLFAKRIHAASPGRLAL